MLRHLYIKDFVLINELNLDFHSGFSTFIGETGAGKSILIDAISILCADRASSSLVSRGHVQNAQIQKDYAKYHPEGKGDSKPMSFPELKPLKKK